MITVKKWREERRESGGLVVRYFRHKAIYLLGLCVWHTEIELDKVKS